MRTLEELIGRREEARIDDQEISKGGVDQTMVQRAIDAEKKMKRLRMAKYSVELFDEIVTEMMKEKRTMKRFNRLKWYLRSHLPTSHSN